MFSRTRNVILVRQALFLTAELKYARSLCVNTPLCANRLDTYTSNASSPPRGVGGPEATNGREARNGSYVPTSSRLTGSLERASGKNHHSVTAVRGDTQSRRTDTRSLRPPRADARTVTTCTRASHRGLAYGIPNGWEGKRGRQKDR